jgi:ABC-type multidrug transport system fused ATPase/permease subunit
MFLIGVLVTRLASDASLLNALAAGRLGQIIQNMAMVAAGLIIAFINGWKLTLGTTIDLDQLQFHLLGLLLSSSCGVIWWVG